MTSSIALILGFLATFYSITLKSHTWINVFVGNTEQSLLLKHGVQNVSLYTVRACKVIICVPLY
jgi:hypothetical protein